MTAETAVLPAHPPRSGPLPAPGSYQAAPERCILEISHSLGPFTALRRRCTVRESLLVIAADDQKPRLTVEAEERAHRPIRFTATDITTTASGGLTIAGEMSVRDRTVPISLHARVVDQDADRLLIIGTGRADRIKLLLAADFR